MVTQKKELPLFAIRLKQARERIGISQMELGVQAGIDEYSASARINQYERGKHTPDFSTACNLAKVLDIPTAYFYSEDELLAELIRLFATLDKNKQKSLVTKAKNSNPATESLNK